MQVSDREEMCPRCRSVILRSWDELDDDEKLLAERLPASAEYSRQERKKHRFCTRCWFEEVVGRETTA
jgi:Zn-finger nucleic acid-binding protein